jgi:hypothetical protein
VGEEQRGARERAEAVERDAAGEAEEG